MTTWPKIVTRLNAMMTLLPDWDGHGAIRPKRRAIERGLIFSGVAMNSGWAAPISAVPSDHESVLMTFGSNTRNTEFDIVAEGAAAVTTVDFETGEVQRTELENF